MTLAVFFARKRGAIIFGTQIIYPSLRASMHTTNAVLKGTMNAGLKAVYLNRHTQT